MEINWLAVFIASLSSFVIGAVWFGPKTFYPIWIKAIRGSVPTERTEMKLGETLLLFGGTYLGALIQVATLAFVFMFFRELAPGFGASTELSGASLSPPALVLSRHFLTACLVTQTVVFTNR
jgi:hypothetical protein